MIKYSFVVPVYNVADYLRRCVESIINQDYPDEGYEIILVDDGSTDSSGTICDEFADRYSNISTIHQENKGLLMARGEGVRHSSGRYILFVDSDDHIESGLLSVVDGYINQYSPDFLCFGYMTDKGGEREYHPVTLQKFELLDKKGFLVLFVGSDKYNTIWSKVIKGDILRENVDEIYDLRLNIGEDRLQTAYLVRESDKIMLISDCLYHYSVRDDSIVHFKKKKDIYDIIAVNKRVEAILKDVLEKNKISANAGDESLKAHRANSINVALDHIYKFDKRRDISRDEKLSTLAEISKDFEDFFKAEKSVIKRIRIYNRFRLRMLIHGNLKMLIRTDALLYMMQKCGL